MTPSRLRLLSMAAILLVAGLVALSWSQTWFLLRLSGAEYPVGGAVAGGALLPLALASLCVLAALALAGPVFRVLLGVLDALLGVCVVTVSAWALSDPVRASLPALVDATGLSGNEEAFLQEVASTVTTPWPGVGLAAGVLMILVGLGVAVTSRAWPVSGRKYSRVRAVDAETGAVADWDALSEGDDPTAGPR